MADFNCLRRLDAESLRLQRMLDSVLDAGVQADLMPVTAAPCLRFELQQPAWSAVCRVDAVEWAAVHLPALAGLDWGTLPPPLLEGLVDTATPLDLLAPALAYGHARVLPTVALPATTCLPAVTAAEGQVWLESLEGQLPAGPDAVLPGSLVLPLHLDLASLHLGVCQLGRLQPGDILLLPGPAPFLASGRHGLFACAIDFEQETLTMSNSPIAPPAATEPQTALDVGGVLLRLDIGFDDIELSVAALARLRAGSVLPLPAQAAASLRISHNGRCIATGELVQVGDSLAVQLTQAPRLA